MRVLPRLSLIAVAGALLTSAACGGGDETAEDLVPDLSDEGFAVFEEGRDPLTPPELDTYRALYQSSEGLAATVIVYVQESEEAAEEQYATLARALENPPPEFFGSEANQVETDRLEIGDESRAFVTEDPDDRGNRVWTDVYRSGKVILITQVLSTEDAAELRETIAKKVI